MTSTPKVTLLSLPPFSDASSAERRICWKRTLKGTWNGKPVKNLPTKWGGLRRKTGRPMRTSQPHREADESQRIMLLVKKPPNPVGNWGGKPDKGSINEKLPKLDEECGRKTERLYCQWKNLSTLTRTEKKKPTGWSIEKLLKQIIKTKGKTGRWINEKRPNRVGTEEENRS